MPPLRRDVLMLLAAGLCGGATRAFAAPTFPARVFGAPARGGPPALDGDGAFDVRAFGATGDGRTIDTPAINRAIAAAAGAGGGTVRFPAGTYACFSIHLRSFVALHLEPGATILAADCPTPGTPGSGYDVAEPNVPWDAYQDFGHSHWHNSLIWGEDIHDIAIFGPGRIWGRGLVRERDEPGRMEAKLAGVGNKAIALKRCRNVILRDVAILEGGHFAILASGVDTLTIDNVRIDTNRDGMDIDCCRNVRVSNCTVNSPWDDAICLKSSLALGEARITENVTISDCAVFGDYRLGTLLDGSFQPLGHEAGADPGRRTGRIKLGTESNGGFRNIAIANCTFQSCCGIALETVDGGALEDVTITGVTMRDLRNAPLFLRLGARLRGPVGTVPGALRRVSISNLLCDAPRAACPSIISGVPGHPVEDIRISDMYMLQKGGGTPAMAAVQPPEEVAAYPDPGRLGPLPAQGFFIRHARELDFSNIEIACATPDARPVFWMYDVEDIGIDRLRATRSSRASALASRDVTGLRVSDNR